MTKELLALVLLAALTAPAVPAPEGAPAEAKPLARTVEKWQDMRASKLIGAKAVDAKGEALGRVEDLILSSETGDVHYAVLSFGGRLELGDRQYTLPLSALAPGPHPGELIVLETRSPATGADLAQWLRDYDPNAPLADRRFMRSSELLGRRIDDGRGRRVGELEDLVVNLGSGRLRHVVAEMHGKQVALPLHALVVPLLRDGNLRMKSG